MEFELLKWADGTVNLCHEDLGNGDDIIFVLKEDGTVERVTWEFSEAQPAEGSEGDA